MNCKTCGGELSGRQKTFYSRQCKNADTNRRHQNYELQQLRGWERKRSLVEGKGGKCQECGYDKNLAALCFHHEEPGEKEFGITIRECSNNSLEVLMVEVEKCRLLCHNCHIEEYHPEHRVVA